MLDSETKARIDSARDILVGKVPDPKSQVEQITIALIYKFMGDMDRQSEELGGKATFFSGEYKKYAWNQLLDKRLGGHERLLLYAEGIEKMNENKNIPQLFRDIFRGVFLPYRDPETLNLFLKEINGFTYDHSERLGDAYEHLLNVLGTQGDAGQFRTPRHIIDFIVAVVDPQKHETVLDPACGTAGFLISAYKHILKHNENLSPDERGRLMANFRGYDIAPDMGRLSRVNLYLHGFRDPVILEYDALTSEERWDERYDVIMANPPFMTPKGGIRPHKRFSITATRSEVLFVDYIAEHLNPNGRAGVIVPEGVIFQSQTAYKKLRRVLVENYLWAVVSMPAGVFNPYSGVKTSILLLDRNLARRTDEVVFVKISNDGFDLGAQRRPIDKNDLPEAFRILIGHKQEQRTRENEMSLCVSRKRLLDHPDCNLSGDRYRTAAVRGSAKWPMVPIGQICTLTNGRAFEPSDWERAETGGLPIIRIQNLNNPSAQFNYFSGRVSEKLIARTGDLLFSWSGSRGTSFGPHTWNAGHGILNQHIFKVEHNSTVHRQFLYWMLKKAVEQVEENLHGGVGLVHITKGNLERIEIPVPPLDEQERIVSELEGYRKIIDGARQVVFNYKPSMPIDPQWPKVRLKEVITGKPKNGYSGKPVDYPTATKVLSLSATTAGCLNPARFKYLDEEISETSPVRCRKGDILLQRGNTAELVGTAALFDIDDEDYIYPDLMIRVRADENVVLSMFLVAALQSPDARAFVKNNASGSAGSMPKINQDTVESIPIPLPPLQIQRQIVDQIEVERALVESNRKLIHIFEAKIKTKLDEIWGEGGGEIPASHLDDDVEIEEQDIGENTVPADDFPTK
jgi:type I restriction enzyme M protein